jgi:hypothetical protein
LPKAATTIWTIMVRSKPLDNSSALQQAEGALGWAHRPFPGFEEVAP